MKHFAQLDKNNQVKNILVSDDFKTNEWFIERFGGTWLETTEERKNFPGIGYIYHSELDAFIRPKPFDSWVLDEETAQWEAPVEYPTDGKDYSWDEETISWVEIPQDEE